jgi:serine/threonine protein kinase
MPFIEGETLRDRLNRETQLSVEEAVKITTEVAGALDYAHRHGVELVRRARAAVGWVPVNGPQRKPAVAARAPVSRPLPAPVMLGVMRAYE